MSQYKCYLLLKQESLAVGIFKPFIAAAHSEQVKTHLYLYEGSFYDFIVTVVVVVVVVVLNEVDLVVSLCSRCCFAKA